MVFGKLDSSAGSSALIGIVKSFCLCLRPLDSFFIYEGCNSGIVPVCINMRGAREAAAADRRAFSCSLLVFFFFVESPLR